MNKQCTLCPELVKSRKKICWPVEFSTIPNGPIEGMVIAEAPGVNENNSGEPLVGAGGQEARHHLTINGIAGRGVILGNLLNCHPPLNRDPLASEVENCTTHHLIPFILHLRPKWIISMGRFSTRFFLGDVDMEMVHGIPHTIDFHGHRVIILPTYHPAAGLHSPEQMILFQSDMKTAAEVIRGKVTPHPPMDEYAGMERYQLVTSASQVRRVLSDYQLSIRQIIAIDTEWARSLPWCLSFSVQPGESWVVMADQHKELEVLNEFLNRKPEPIALIHNALYDIPVLGSMGISTPFVADTMVMAYLLQTEPQGLKVLSKRHCGMDMSTYSEMVSSATRRKAMDYLGAASQIQWPNPDLALEWKGGEPYVRKPQNIGRKIARILKGVESNGDNPFEKWKAIKEGKEPVEELLGPLTEGELCDIPRDDAINYAARDADATLRVFPVLWDRVVALGLENTFWRDMRALPMIVDMMAAGMPVDLNAFSEVSEYFQRRMDLLQRKMQLTVGHHLDGKILNPGSYPQMSTLIYDKLKLHEKGGRHKSKKGAVHKSTANDILMRYVKLHPVVQDIIDWREYQKLRGTYADAIPKLTSPDGRVRATFRITRTATGRLSTSNPNLMAQPTRSEEGKKVRDCYVAPPGRVIVSCDYSQIEMRCAASMAKDERMMEIFWQDLDIHAQTASAIFKVPVDQLDEMKHRYPAKRIGFGILYMITADGLHRELQVSGIHEWTLKDCSDMIAEWFNVYSGIAKMMKKTGSDARRYGYVRDMFGRVRFIPGIKSTNKWVRLEAERQAGNAPVQMSAQGVVKGAMGNLKPFYRDFNRQYGERGLPIEKQPITPILQIHDDIPWEMDEWTLPVVAPEIREIMESAAPEDFSVPLKVDFKSGRKWGSMEKFQF